MKYDLERLGPYGFQDLCAALAKRALGAGVRPMGRGRDGGRDMITIDPIRWSEATVWAGTTVFQVKHTTLLQSSSAATFARAIVSELTAWADPESDRGVVPEQLVFVTNVFLSAVPDTGGFDAVTRKISTFTPINENVTMGCWPAFAPVTAAILRPTPRSGSPPACTTGS